MNTSFHVVRRRDLGRSAWDAFADASDEAWLWHRYDLREAVETWPGSSDESFAVLSAIEEQPLALMPLRRITRRFGGLLPLHILESLGGIALRNELGERRRRAVLAAVREQLIELSRRGGCVEIRILLSPMTPVLRGENCPRVSPLVEMGCDNTLSQTWVVDLRPGADALWKGMEGRARTAIRKAEKMGVVVREARPEDWTVYYRLHQETYRRTGARPHPDNYFRIIWDRFLAGGLARIWIAEHEGTPVAAENFGVYKQAATYWTGAASARGLDAEANSLLQWTAMRWMAGNGVEWYETGEAFPQATGGKEKGLNDFKKSFSGQLFPLYKGCLATGTAWERAYRCFKEIRK
jgi:Acetyltransferase (GNAT) domain